MHRQKRGESTIIANLILFVAVMGMAGAAVFIFKNMVDDGTNAAAMESKRTVDVMKTSFTVTSAAYTHLLAPGTDTITIYVKNTGKASFDPDDVDVYIDDIRIPRNNANRTVQVMPDTDLVSTGIWDETEELEFRVYQNYSIPAIHTVKVYTPNGVKAESEFSS